jgi:competence protein ComEA
MTCPSNRETVTAPQDKTTFRQRLQWFGLLFARRDQPYLVLVLMACMVGMGVFYWRHAAETGGLIDIDQLPSRTAQFQVDLNTADWGEIVNLPGVGPSLASQIVDYRQAEGSFSAVEDVQLIHGIGPKKFAKMLPFLAPLGDER